MSSIAMISMTRTRLYTIDGQFQVFLYLGVDGFLIHVLDTAISATSNLCYFMLIAFLWGVYIKLYVPCVRSCIGKSEPSKHDVCVEFRQDRSHTWTGNTYHFESSDLIHVCFVESVFPDLLFYKVLC